MKVICYSPDNVCSSKGGVFFVEMKQSEFESKVKETLDEEQLAAIEEIVSGEELDDDEKTYRVFVRFNRIKQHKYYIDCIPAFRAWPSSAMNDYTRIFINKNISDLNDIRKFYFPHH